MSSINRKSALHQLDDIIGELECLLAAAPTVSAESTTEKPSKTKSKYPKAANVQESVVEPKGDKKGPKESKAAKLPGKDSVEAEADPNEALTVNSIDLRHSKSQNIY